MDGEDDVIDKFGSIVLAVLDQLFERAVSLSSYPTPIILNPAQDTRLDEYLGHHKPANVKISPTLTQIVRRHPLSQLFRL